MRLRDGRFQYCRETDKFNGATFFAFLKSLRRTSIRSGRRVVVITGNAKYLLSITRKRSFLDSRPEGSVIIRAAGANHLSDY